MPNQDVLPPSLPPRLIARSIAAAYVGVSPNTFDQMIEGKLMPLPKMVGKRKLWDVRELDRAVDELPSDDDPIVNSWDKLHEVKSNAR